MATCWGGYGALPALGREERGSKRERRVRCGARARKRAAAPSLFSLSLFFKGIMGCTASTPGNGGPRFLVSTQARHTTPCVSTTTAWGECMWGREGGERKQTLNPKLAFFQPRPPHPSTHARPHSPGPASARPGAPTRRPGVHHPPRRRPARPPPRQAGAPRRLRRREVVPGPAPGEGGVRPGLSGDGGGGLHVHHRSLWRGGAPGAAGRELMERGRREGGSVERSGTQQHSLSVSFICLLPPPSLPPPSSLPFLA